MSKRRLSSGDQPSEAVEEAQAKKQLLMTESASLTAQVAQLKREKQEMMIEVVTLTGDVARLKHELAAADAERKRSSGMVNKLLERCDLLEYERDGLRSKDMTANKEKKRMEGEISNLKETECERDGLRVKLNSANEKRKEMENELTYLKETTNLLVDKVNWYKNNSPSDEKIVQEEREKNKKDQETKDWITALEMLLSTTEKEKEGMIDKLKEADVIYAKLTEDNNKLVEELKYSLESRQKLNKNIDELEQSMKMMRSRHIQEGLKSAEDLIASRKEKEEMMNELRKREDEKAIVFQSFTPSLLSPFHILPSQSSRFVPSPSPLLPHFRLNTHSPPFLSPCNSIPITGPPRMPIRMNAMRGSNGPPNHSNFSM